MKSYSDCDPFELYTVYSTVSGNPSTPSSHLSMTVDFLNNTPSAEGTIITFTSEPQASSFLSFCPESRGQACMHHH